MKLDRHIRIWTLVKVMYFFAAYWAPEQTESISDKNGKVWLLATE